MSFATWTTRHFRSDRTSRSTWSEVHRRGDVLRDVVDHADLRRDGVLPWDVDGVAATFVDRLDLVGALQLRWHTRLAGRIDHQLAQQPTDPEAAVLRAWVVTAENMPGVRAVLDRQLLAPESPEVADALIRAMDIEHAMLALMAGRASSSSRLDPRAVQAGRAVEEAARASYRPAAALPSVPSVPQVAPRAVAPVAARLIEHRVPQAVTAPAITSPTQPTQPTQPVERVEPAAHVPAGSAAFVARVKAALAAA